MGWPVCNTTIEDTKLSETAAFHGWTAHQLFVVVAGPSTMVAIVLSLSQIFMHGIRYSRPHQQRNVTRILFMVPVYAVSNLLAAGYYWHQLYFVLAGNAYAAFGLASFFNLLGSYLAEDLHSQKAYFRTIQPKRWAWPIPWLQRCFGGQKGFFRTPRSGLTYFNVIFVGVYQYCFVLVAMSTAGLIAQPFGRYCLESLSPAFAHIWVLVINTLSAIVSSYCLGQFHKEISRDVEIWKSGFQYFCINIVLYLSTYQTLIITILLDTGILKASENIQIPDLKVALPSTLLCLEMAIVSFLHLFAYPSQPYVIGSKQNLAVTPPSLRGQQQYEGGFLAIKALVDALNPWDIVKSIGRAARWLFIARKSRTQDPSYRTTLVHVGYDSRVEDEIMRSDADNIPLTDSAFEMKKAAVSESVQAHEDPYRYERLLT